MASWFHTGRTNFIIAFDVVLFFYSSTVNTIYFANYANPPTGANQTLSESLSNEPVHRPRQRIQNVFTSSSLFRFPMNRFCIIYYKANRIVARQYLFGLRCPAVPHAYRILWRKQRSAGTNPIDGGIETQFGNVSLDDFAHAPRRQKRASRKQGSLCGNGFANTKSDPFEMEQKRQRNSHAEPK